MAALWSQNMHLVAALVALTAIVMPLAELVALAYLIVPLRYGSRAPGFGIVFRAFQFANRWGMVEVFVLGTLVSYVKLGHLANVEPGSRLTVTFQRGNQSTSREVVF